MRSMILKNKAGLLFGLLMVASLVAGAQPKEPSTLSNPLAQVLVAIMVMLAIAIAILGNVVNSAAALFREKMRKERAAAKAALTSAAPFVLLVLALFASLQGMAQDAAATPAAATVNAINGLTPLTFYVMISVIAVEIAILIALVYQLKFLVGIESKAMEVVTAKETAPAKPKISWWDRFNQSKAIEEEAAIDLSHDYDGISELDNKMPPWWIAAFSLTILFSVVYLYRYHVSHSAPLQIEELEIAMKQAEVEKKAYLAKAANNVDENSITMMDASAIASGKTLFDANCIACHGNAGEGNAVGPNLTDEYWIHGGGISDVFKTIKYGWPDKGMRSWKDDFSPVQMAQLSSYVMSLKGTNPPNAKEPQGEKYQESKETTPAANDSTSVASN